MAKKPEKKAAPKIETTPMTDAELDQELEALLSNATGTVQTNEVIAANEPIINMDEIEQNAQAVVLKEQAYVEQEPEQSSGAAAQTVTVTKPAKTVRTPRPSRAAGAKASAVLLAQMDAPELLKAALLVNGDSEDPALVDQLKAGIDTLAKKVGDKAVNLLKNQGDPKKLQNYTRKGLEFLVQHGAASSTTLTDHLVKCGYTIGTARSQANQLMALLPTLKVAERAGKNLTLNTDSTIVANFQAALATA